MDYQLLPHEYMIMNSDDVSFGKNGLYTDDLILTNLHLIHIKKSIFGGRKGQIIIPINQIKIFEGKPQVSVTKTNGSKRLEIYYNGGQVIFSFSNTKDTEKWATNIIKLISGDTSNFATLGDNSLFGVEILAETLKDTFDTAEPEKLSTKCSFCGAPLSGTVKQTVKCSFCDMEQTL